MTSKFERLSGKSEVESDGTVWDRYGLSESEWGAMRPEERVIHYNRMNKCEHKANMHEWPTDLYSSYSFDPYVHTPHMEPCKRWGIKPPERWGIECACNMCLGKFGLTEEDLPLKVNEEAVRLKWQQKFAREEGV